jgi:hypothetical protein
MKQLIITLATAVLCGAAIASAILLTKKDDSKVHNPYSPSDFNSNYQIDLKQDGYLILDEDGEVYYVPFNQLENWFLEMNK